MAPFSSGPEPDLRRIRFQRACPAERQLWACMHHRWLEVTSEAPCVGTQSPIHAELNGFLQAKDGIREAPGLMPFRHPWPASRR